jgi:hypothetical protein
MKTLPDLCEYLNDLGETGLSIVNGALVGTTSNGMPYRVEKINGHYFETVDMGRRTRTTLTNLYTLWDAN